MKKVVYLLSMVLILALAGNVKAYIINDNFNDNSIDPGIWIVSSGTPAETGGIIRINSANSVTELLTTVNTWSMDYDLTAQVDWLNYSQTNTGESSFRMTGLNWAVWLNREYWGTSQVRFILDNPNGTRVVSMPVSTANTSGKFKLVYTASSKIITGYWYNGTSWVTLGSTNGYTLSQASGIKIDMRAWSGGTTGLTIDFDNFSADGGAPTKASSPVPDNNAVNVAIDADLSWTAGQGAASHNVYFGKSSPGTLQGNQTATTFNPGTLDFNTQYYWQIDELVGPDTITGDVWTFTTASGAATSPVPADGAANVASAVMLQWQAPIPASYYNVYFGTDMNAVNNASDPNQPPGQGYVAVTQFNVSNLEANSTYYWRVDPVYPSLSPVKGTVWSFVTGSQPSAAQNPVPADGGTKRVIPHSNLELRWAAGSGAESHDVYFGTSNPPPFIDNQGADNTRYAAAVNEVNETYYWRINEKNSYGVTAGPIWSFTTAETMFGDINGDGVVDILDLTQFAVNWLETGCVTPDLCGWADLNQDTQVDLVDFASLAADMSPASSPPYTDYCAMLSHNIQGKEHAFLAGKLVYYIGGQYWVWNKQEDETIGLTHPFFHDLRSRGYGMAQDATTGYGHDLSGWEFYRDTRIAYGTVIINGTQYANPVPSKMYWRPDRVICEYTVGGVNIREEKFISLNDVVCSIIKSDSPVEIRFDGQSYVNPSKSIARTSTISYDEPNNVIHVVEGGTITVNPQEGLYMTGKLMYDGMSTVVSASKNFKTSYSSYRDTAGRQRYSFQVPCDSSGVSIVWAMDDVYSNALGRAKDVLADPAARMSSKTDYVNDFLNNQIPYFRCSDPEIVNIYYYLWSIYGMYYIDVNKGWEKYPHTQTAVNNFLGMHRFDANFQIKVGAWTADKDYYAYGNVLLWKSLLPYAHTGGQLPDNMGIGWLSPYWETAIEHVVGAWEIYQHTGDENFIRDCYDEYFKPLFWNGIYDIWGAKYDGLECLRQMALLRGKPDDAAHWSQMMDPAGMQAWMNDMWGKNGVTNFFGAYDQYLEWSGMAYMRNKWFPDDWASLMTQTWAMDSVNGFYGTVPLLTVALKDWAHIYPDFASVPDGSYMSIIGMYYHHVGNNANICTLNHLKKYNMRWGIPVAPESYDKNFNIWGDQYSNFNAGKILLILKGIAGLDYSIPNNSFTFCDMMPKEWSSMSVKVPLKKNGTTYWTGIDVTRQSKDNGMWEKTIRVSGNVLTTLNIQPWLEDKTLVDAPTGYIDQQPRGHISYELNNTADTTMIINLQQ